MANVAIFETNKEPQYLLSVNTPDYAQRDDVLVNPDITAVLSVPKKFWKRSGDSIVEMTQVEKDAVLADEEAAKEARTQAFEDLTALELAKALVLLNSQSKPTTKANLVTAVKALRS